MHFCNLLVTCEEKDPEYTYSWLLPSRSDAGVKHVCEELRHNGKVLAVAGLGSNQNSVSLGDCDEKLANLIWLRIHAVSLDDCHVMLIELEELAGEGSHVDNVEHVCFPRGDVEHGVLAFVDQRSIWNRLGTIVVIRRQVVVN